MSSKKSEPVQTSKKRRKKRRKKKKHKKEGKEIPDEMIQTIVREVTSNVIKEISTWREEMKNETKKELSEMVQRSVKEEISPLKKRDTQQRSRVVKNKKRSFVSELLESINDHPAPQKKETESILSRKEWEIIYPLLRDEIIIMQPREMAKYTLFKVEGPSDSYKLEFNMSLTSDLAITENYIPVDIRLAINNLSPVSGEIKKKVAFVNLKGCTKDIVRMIVKLRLGFCAFHHIPKQISFQFEKRIFNVDCPRMNTVLIGYCGLTSNEIKMITLLATHETKMRNGKRMEYYAILELTGKAEKKVSSWTMKIEGSPSIKRKSEGDKTALRKFY